VIVLSVVHQGLTKAEAARKFDVSWQWVHTLVTRYHTGGLDALEPRSRKPHSSPVSTPPEVRTRILELRSELTGAGLDAGPVTIAWHLDQEHHTGGKNGFEHLLAQTGITQKNGHPYHPQTQGKIERFHQTLKLWLGKQPPAATLSDLQNQLDQFQRIYNDTRPHRALNRQTPRQAYDATIKATPALAAPGTHFRIRTDTIDRHGKVTIRHAGALHHLGVGRAHGGTPVLILIDTTDATVTGRDTGEVLGTYRIDPDHNYWPKQEKPDQRPGSS